MKHFAEDFDLASSTKSPNQGQEIDQLTLSGICLHLPLPNSPGAYAAKPRSEQEQQELPAGEKKANQSNTPPQAQAKQE